MIATAVPLFAEHGLRQRRADFTTKSKKNMPNETYWSPSSARRFLLTDFVKRVIGLEANRLTGCLR
jgi:hypothetical protein